MAQRPNNDDLTRKNARTGLTVLACVAIMVGVSFAAVPLYDMFCRVTGFGGTTQTAQSLPDQVLEREMTVKFNADTSPTMAWEFKPEQRSIKVQVGARGITAYSAKNLSNRPTAGTAIYNVTPLKMGKYFHKIQCFCFDAQTLQAGEEVSMPVLFFVDPAIADDPNLDDVTSVTLSYTFFPAESEELDAALETFYNTN